MATPYAPISGFSTTGAQPVVTSGLDSVTRVQASYPFATITVYLGGTTTLAPIYSDSNGTPLSNPFTANADGSWLFWQHSGTVVDVVMSGGNPPFPQPVTLPSILVGHVDITGSVGPPGIPGTAATVAVGTTSTVASGNPASVTNSGTASAAVFNFTIPQGPPGPVGPGSTVPGPQGPAGTNGTNGSNGATGPAGAAATIAVGTTTTGGTGVPASVTNSGSVSAAVFDFVIPQGPQGSVGGIGPQGIPGVASAINSSGGTGFIGNGALGPTLLFDLPPATAGQGYRITAYFTGAGITAAQFLLSGVALGAFNPSISGMQSCMMEMLVVNLNGTQTSQLALVKTIQGSTSAGAQAYGLGPQQAILTMNFVNLQSLELELNVPAGTSYNAWWIIESI